MLAVFLPTFGSIWAVTLGLPRHRVQIVGVLTIVVLSSTNGCNAMSVSQIGQRVFTSVLDDYFTIDVGIVFAAAVLGGPLEL